MSRRTNTMLAAGAFTVLLAAGPAAWANEEGPGQAAMQALSGAKVSLQQAVATAQQKTGGRAFEATIEQDNGVPAYWIATVANGGGVTHLRVDPMSGAVRVSPGQAIAGLEHQQDATLAAGAKLDLAAAIKAVAGLAQGTVADASLNNENGQAVYQVAIANGGGIQQFKVDAATGKVTVSPQGQDQGDRGGQGGHGEQGGHEGGGGDQNNG